MEMDEKRNESKQSIFKLGQMEYHRNANEDGGANENFISGSNRLPQWPTHSSRIYRVSRASGGKDRHSKVFTSKGLRDRRVRLSVSTAIQFYDLQDRLGYDQPSKAIEWLLNAASTAIAELPSLGSSFAELSSPAAAQTIPEPRMAVVPDHEPQQQQNLSMSKSGSSSTSENSKGSVLSLSRSEVRIESRKRARQRAAKYKDREGALDLLVTTDNSHGRNETLNLDNSLTELLTAATSGTGGSSNPLHLPASSVTADHFAQSSLFTRAPTQSQKNHTQKQLSSFSSPQAHFLNSSAAPTMVPYHMSFAAAAEDHPEMQQLSFIQDHMDYNSNINFSIATGFTGFQRGTLQSNSSPHLTQHQHYLLRFSSPPSCMDGPFMPLVFGAASAEEDFHPGFDSRPQLNKKPTTPFMLDGYRSEDLNGKGKS
ncbi:hypothetical protein HPP92_017136 [Vanilla planifolia]|uniref:TCP domain-containing protein n=1 Tax=Vanilla planifolia TaxID=51239 RepID=A0A835QFH2_VANPL|nr:hypothetical protein HPP92_017136 [Vanilla planifolia]